MIGIDWAGGGEVTSALNKPGCSILTKTVVVPKNPGTHLKLRPKNPGTRNASLSFLLSEKIYHPDKKVLDINSTFELYLFHQRILLFNFCVMMFVRRVLNFLQLLSV